MWTRFVSPFAWSLFLVKPKEHVGIALEVIWSRKPVYYFKAGDAVMRMLWASCPLIPVDNQVS